MIRIFNFQLMMMFLNSEINSHLLSVWNHNDGHAHVCILLFLNHWLHLSTNIRRLLPVLQLMLLEDVIFLELTAVSKYRMVWQFCRYIWRNWNRLLCSIAQKRNVILATLLTPNEGSGIRASVSTKSTYCVLLNRTASLINHQNGDRGETVL